MQLEKVNERNRDTDGKEGRKKLRKKEEGKEERKVIT